MVQPHTLADDFENIDDPKWPIAFMRAQFAMIGMIDSDQRVHVRIRRRLKFVPLQLALERRKNPDIDTLQADRRLPQIDEFDAGDRMQEYPRRLP